LDGIAQPTSTNVHTYHVWTTPHVKTVSTTSLVTVELDSPEGSVKLTSMSVNRILVWMVLLASIRYVLLLLVDISKNYLFEQNNVGRKIMSDKNFVQKSLF